MTILFIAGAVVLTAFTFYQIGHSDGETAGYQDAVVDGMIDR
jgi:hypothetical protein